MHSRSYCSFAYQPSALSSHYVRGPGKSMQPKIPSLLNSSCNLTATETINLGLRIEDITKKACSKLLALRYKKLPPFGPSSLFPSPSLLLFPPSSPDIHAKVILKVSIWPGKLSRRNTNKLRNSMKVNRYETEVKCKKKLQYQVKKYKCIHIY